MDKSNGFCSVSDFEVFKDKLGILKYAHFFYTVGKYTVDVLYSEDASGLDMPDYFQPSRGLSSINIGEVFYPQKYASPNS